jgi:hypothetical protein
MKLITERSIAVCTNEMIHCSVDVVLSNTKDNSFFTLCRMGSKGIEIMKIIKHNPKR